ncbi:MAG: shikimate dehydrogenase [Cryomorphaceae bacterium MED-G11]|nr:MAG: shikimate dehydrogenase [Cryomorphaceae bacterium MED-G11]
MRNKKQFGLIGKNIEYSFSRKFFSEKFSSDNKYSNYDYTNYDIESIHDLNNVFNSKNLCGLNVTIPYKEKIISFLDKISDEAEQIGAVNTICFENGSKVGYNTDIFGFTESLKMNKIDNIDSALILGTGGAAKTIIYFCNKNNIPFNVVSRQESNLNLSYNELNEDIFNKRVLIVNCTPLGTYPDIKKCPKLPYELINKENILFDLVYNPSETLFMKKGKEIGCKTLNGYQMLRLQAEKSWEIWADYIK